MSISFSRFVCCIFSVLVFSITFGDTFAADPPKNVIIMIGDGMGFNSDAAGTFYRFGEPGKQRYHAFPVHLGCTTFSQAKKDKPISGDVKGYDPEVIWSDLAGMHQGTDLTAVTDSAASSTAIHSGKKTMNGKIGIDANGNNIELVSEVAKKLGKKVGCVTTVQMSHATPAGFSAHDSSRGNLDVLFNQMIAETSPLSVVFGTGHPSYHSGRKVEIIASDKENLTAEETAKIASQYLYVGGEKTWKQMQTGTVNGFTVIETREQFNELAAAKEARKPIPEKVVGVVRSLGSLPPVDAVLDDLPATKNQRNNAYPKTEWNELPTLACMSIAALNVLSHNNDNGFMIMIEGGAIDGANHNQKIDGCVCEHLGFAKAIDAVIDWVEKYSNWDETLFIITADHETGNLWPEKTYDDANADSVFDKGEPFFGFRPMPKTDRGIIPAAQYASKGHSNQLVPLWAKGAGADLFLKAVRGRDEKAAKIWNFSGDYIDDTDIADVIRKTLVP